MDKYELVRCRHKTKNIVKNMPYHITQKAFFKQDWVVEDNGVHEEKILQNPNDLTALIKKVEGMGMKTNPQTTKDEMIAFMNEPKKVDEPKKIEVTEKLPPIEKQAFDGEKIVKAIKKASKEKIKPIGKKKSKKKPTGRPKGSKNKK